MLYFSNFNCQLKLKHLEFCYFIHLVDYHGILQLKMRFNVKNLPPSVNSANAGDYRLNSFLEPFASNGNSFFCVHSVKFTTPYIGISFVAVKIALFLIAVVFGPKACLGNHS